MIAHFQKQKDDKIYHNLLIILKSLLPTILLGPFRSVFHFSHYLTTNTNGKCLQIGSIAPSMFDYYSYR